MSLLEERYRRVLRVLPASYRAEREEEMVDAFLESVGEIADADERKPRWSEVASVVALSVRVRLGGIGAAPRAFAAGETVRLVALLGLLLNAVLSAMHLGWLLRVAGVFGPIPDFGPGFGLGWSSPGSVPIVEGLASVAWITAYAALIGGRPGVARAAALLALLPAGWDLAVDVVAAVSSANPDRISVLYLLFGVIPALALLAGFHRDAPPVHRARWMIAVPVATGVPLWLLGASLLGWKPAPLAWIWADTWGIAGLIVVVAGVVCLAVHRFSPGRRTPAWPLALAVLALLLLPLRVQASIDYLSVPELRGQAPLVVALTAALLLVAGALLISGVRSARRLPKDPAAPRPA
ncbi:hypothetical protein [Rhizohabitans arisaemae]|uniref:hypothetical protein n=1 Tax=Rhizohabitans arisaemae TaxID=2720610 RepID=UPI0024B059D5|nr:hypothetical protein [Rhizohabitans arisaemae]